MNGGQAEADNAVTPRRRPWTANGPEARLSIAVDRFLRRALVMPFYVVAIHDSDGGARTMTQRIRDANRGIRKGQLDWVVVQWPGLYRPLELKRGANTLTPAQRQTVADLTACGVPPIVAKSLRQTYEGLAGEGFRFTAGVETVLAHAEALLEAWDREAALVLSGDVVRPKAKARKVGPRFVWKATAG